MSPRSDRLKAHLAHFCLTRNKKDSDGYAARHVSYTSVQDKKADRLFHEQDLQWYKGAHLISIYQFKRWDVLCVATSYNLSNSHCCPINKNMYFIHIYMHTHISETLPHLPLLYFSAVPLAVDKDLNGFKFCFFFFFSLTSKEFFPTQTNTPSRRGPP